MARVRFLRLSILASFFASACEVAHVHDQRPSSAEVSPPAAATPGARRLTLEELYDPEKKVDFSGRPRLGQIWLDEGHWLAFQPADPGEPGEGEKRALMVVDAASGAAEPFGDVAALRAALRATPGIGEEAAKGLAGFDPAAMNAARSAQLFHHAGDLWAIAFGAPTATRLTATPEEPEEEASFSPDGDRVAFVRGNDLHVVSFGEPGELVLTHDGGERFFNGKLDWIYQEEIYGRGNYRGYWWSLDGAHIAFLRLDEAGVPDYTLVDDSALALRVETSSYPRSGEPNPRASLGIAEVASGEVRWLELSRYAESDPLVVDVAWSVDGRLAYQVQDREQTWLDLVVVGADGHDPRVLIHETTEAWVEPKGSPHFLADGSFLWMSERTGFQHLYLYGADGALRGPVTAGEWEARRLHGLDASGAVYFAATERSPIGLDVYRVQSDGRELTRLSSATGTHNANFSPGCTRFIDAWSDVGTPTQVRLHDSDGVELRVIDANPVPALAEYACVRPEFLQVRTRDGFAMEAMIVKPPGFDPAKRYPVFQHTYAGPHAPQVRDAWLGTNGMFFQLLAQAGVVVWVCDNRSASGKGARASWACYQRLGVSELADIEDGIDWLVAAGIADPQRVGISGWSYGGFMASYALTHSSRFRMGIAGGSVTDWLLYDSIYTERYMKTPASNPDGYASTSVLAAAADLRGELLLVHGAIDDNVHPQNTLRFAHALQKAGKPFELMLYPTARHGVADPAQNLHLRSKMLAFVRDHLLDG